VRGDRAAVGLDQLLGDRQAKPCGCSALAVGVVALEPAERRPCRSSLIPIPVSKHGQPQPVGLVGELDLDRPAARVYLTAFDTRFDATRLERDRVDLGEQRPELSAHLRAGQREPGASAAGCHAATTAPIKAPRSVRSGLVRSLSSLAGGEQQQLVDQADQLVRGVGHRAEVAACAVVERGAGAALDVGRGEQDQRQRRADLVGDVAEEPPRAPWASRSSTTVPASWSRACAARRCADRPGARGWTG